MPPKKHLLVPISLLIVGLILLIGSKFGLWEKDPNPVSNIDRTDTKVSRPAATRENPVLTALARWRDNPTGSSPLQTLKDLQAVLKSMAPGEAIAWIRGFLDSGEDKPTGLEFEIGKGGTLNQWPTLRTFLLDSLHAIDPVAAAEIGRRILTTPTTADEWALALRNVGLTDASPETHAYLRERTEALIANPKWQADPSIGYLNAFDVLVATEATASTPLLSELIRKKDRKDLAHAGFLTLDRLVQRQPGDVLTRLAADRDLHESRPEMVAQQFARADLRDADQRQIVRNWLLDPARTGTELRSFAGVYPNNNRFISDNLLTSDHQQSGGDLAAHDREALEIVNTWASDPAFQPVQEHLHSMIARLNGFVGVPPSPE